MAASLPNLPKPPRVSQTIDRMHDGLRRSQNRLNAAELVLLSRNADMVLKQPARTMTRNDNALEGKRQRGLIELEEAVVSRAPYTDSALLETIKP